MMTALMLALVLTGAVQDPPDVVPGNYLLWDYPNDALANGAVVRFEVQLDAGTWTGVGLPVQVSQLPAAARAKLNAQAALTDQTYALLFPAMTPGDHEIAVRACGKQSCSPAVSLMVKLVMVPMAPINLRIGK